jgi:hypothetical protein
MLILKKPAQGLQDVFDYLTIDYCRDENKMGFEILKHEQTGNINHLNILSQQCELSICL